MYATQGTRKEQGALHIPAITDIVFADRAQGGGEKILQVDGWTNPFLPLLSGGKDRSMDSQGKKKTNTVSNKTR